MMDARGCDGFDPYPCGGERFDECPRKFQSKHPELAAIVETWIDCVGGVIGDGMGAINPVIHLPYPGGMADQPAPIMAAFRVISSKAAKILADRKE